MQKSLIIIFVLAVFSLGWISNAMYAIAANSGAQQPASFNQAQAVFETPADRISQDKIHVFSDKIVLDIEGATWATFTPTHSMEPFISEKANGIELKPNSPMELKVGDIVSYESEFADGLIIHRIIQTGFDEQGWYAIIKGDNNPAADPGKARFEQIHGVLIGIIY